MRASSMMYRVAEGSMRAVGQGTMWTFGAVAGVGRATSRAMTSCVAARCVIKCIRTFINICLTDCVLNRSNEKQQDVLCCYQSFKTGCEAHPSLFAGPSQRHHPKLSLWGETEACIFRVTTPLHSHPPLHSQYNAMEQQLVDLMVPILGPVQAKGLFLVLLGRMAPPPAPTTHPSRTQDCLVARDSE